MTFISNNTNISNVLFISLPIDKMNEQTPEEILNVIDKNEKNYKKRQLSLPSGINNALKTLASDRPASTENNATNDLIVEILGKYINRPEVKAKIERLTRVVA